jgi:hypothetical protein
MKKIHLLFLILFSVVGLTGFSQSIKTLSPSSAKLGESLTVTVVGQNTNFTGGVSSVELIYSSGSPTYTMASGQNIVVVNDTVLTAEISIPVWAYATYHSVKVVSSQNGTLSKNNAFLVKAMPSPAVVSISPSEAKQGETLTVTVVGVSTKFTGGVGALHLYYGQSSPTSTDIVGQNITVINDTALTAQITIPANADLGFSAYSLHVLTVQQATFVKPSFFTVNTSSTATKLKSIFPASAIQGSSLTVTIVGQNTHFTAGVSDFDFQYVSGSTTYLNESNIVVKDDSTFTVDIQIPANSPIASYKCIVKTLQDGTFTMNNAFGVLNDPSDDVLIKTISPNKAKEGTSLSVTIVGQNTHFTNGVNSFEIQYNSASSTIHGANISIVNDTTFTTDISVPLNAVISPYYDCMVNSIQDGVLYKYDGFEVSNDPANDVALLSLSPNQAAQGESLTVTIVGQNTKFTNGLPDVSLVYTVGSSTEIYGTSVSVIDDTHCTANFSLPQNATIGYYMLKVNSAGSYLVKTSAFYVHTSSIVPYIKSLSQNTANRGDAFVLTVIGKNTAFKKGVDSVKLLASFQSTTTEITGTNVSVVDDTTLTASFTIPTNALLWYYDLEVKTTQNGDLISSSMIIEDSVNTISGIINGVIDGKKVWLLNSNGDTVAVDTMLNAYFEFSGIADGDYHILLEDITNNTPPAVSVNKSWNKAAKAYLFLNGSSLAEVTVSTQKIVAENKGILLYPNPANETLNVRLSELYTSLSVYNAMGQNVFSQNASPNESTVSLDLSSFASGTYYLSVLTVNSTQNLPFVVVK